MIHETTATATQEVNKNLSGLYFRACVCVYVCVYSLSVRITIYPINNIRKASRNCGNLNKFLKPENSPENTTKNNCQRKFSKAFQSKPQRQFNILLLLLHQSWESKSTNRRPER